MPRIGNGGTRLPNPYYGLNMIGVPSMGQGIAAGAVSEFNRSGFISPAVNIGATHFWGHADFYVSINTVPIKLEEDAVENSLHMGTFTGLRVYPLACRNQGNTSFSRVQIFPVAVPSRRI